MKTINLPIQMSIEIQVPQGTKLITNDSWITLAYKDKKNGIIKVFTCPKEDITKYDLVEDDSLWTPLRKSELKTLSLMR